ncbi:MAG TPA: TonB-dependent receptor plug domain-containing protein, partial [Cyclobacteriaceae bacterium]|nr:TonB-dependent receptor plug domain-containing protein [Cyclobacteriaceae bacterium]
MKAIALLTLLTALPLALSAQRAIHGTVAGPDGEGLPGASIYLYANQQVGTTSNANGAFQLVVPGHIPSPTLIVSFTGYLPQTIPLDGVRDSYTVVLKEDISQLNEVVVVSGTLKEVSKLDSPVPIEVYTPTFFMKNPAPSLFESLTNVNGVRPQLNCNVCNTGDIHINGLEGPYTMVLIDGMPIVSGLSTVYGLTGIPSALIDRVEIVKGPASTLYGSEAVGGLVNVITKKPARADDLFIDQFATSWAEFNTDIGLKYNLGQKAQSVAGINYFNYQNPKDNNDDGFTDITLSNRLSLFNKVDFGRKHNRAFTLAGRLNYEDRWGGDMRWTSDFRGGDSLYGESIYTKRWEVFGAYQLPVGEKVMFRFSANGHNQNSYYGKTPYLANQKITFGQLTWDKGRGPHDILMGAALRHTWYDDDTPATSSEDGKTNNPSIVWLPGGFVQDEITLSAQSKILAGIRYDYNSIHGNIFTPRFNYKWTSKDKQDILRLSLGNGYRVANVFTEDHAALTGARQVVFLEDLKPETSWNANINYTKKIVARTGFINIDATAFYTYFNNKIVPDYLTNANQIIYANLNGHAVSEGLSLNADVNFISGIKVIAGGTLMNVFTVEFDGAGNKVKSRQLLTENYTAVWSVSIPVTRSLSIDYTGNLYGPMRLPVLGKLDPRSSKSPVWSI